jgi:hypothetical protein
MDYRDCSECGGVATCVCRCGNKYFCDRHFRMHTNTGSDHHSIDIHDAIYAEKYAKVISDINRQMVVIAKSKSQVATEASKMINEIKKSCCEALKKIDKMYENLGRILEAAISREKSIEELKIAIKTKLCSSVSTNSDLTINIQQYFNQEFIQTVIEEDNKEAEIMSLGNLCLRPCIYYIANSLSLQEKIEYCEIHVSNYDKAFIVGKEKKNNIDIKEVLFSYDGKFAFICK